MRKLLIAAICGLMVLPPVSVADDHGRGPPPPAYRNQGRHVVPPQYYGSQQPHGYYGGYRYNGYGGRYPYYRYGGYAPGYYGYAAPYPYYYYGHGNHHDNDDALWAIGGLVLGAIIVSAAQNAAAPPATTAAPPAAPPPSGAPQNCYDDIIHDSAGNPHVERHCYPAGSP